MSKNEYNFFDRPIAFHRAFVDIPTGNGRLGVLGALMLSQAIYWSKRTDDPDGWFYKSREEWAEETGLTRWEQETARKRLKLTGFWHEERRGVPARLYFRVDIKALIEALSANKLVEIPPSSRREYHQQEGGNATDINKNAETTTETTTERDTAANAAGRKAPTRRKRQTHPAVAVYRKIARYNPVPDVREKIASTVTNVELWRRVVEAWVGIGWNPRNVAGMLEYYRRGEIPSTAPRRNGAGGGEKKPLRTADQVLQELGLE